MTQNDNYTNVLPEEMNGKFDQVIELLSMMRDDIQTKASTESVEEIKGDIKIIKAAVTENSTKITTQKRRISLLEKRA